MRFLVLLVVLGSSGLASADSPTFYSYRSDAGRTVYVNRFSLVPPEKRAKARAVDVSQVSLNSDLAEELSGAVVRELRFLKQSDPCAKARQESRISTWRHVWDRHGPWLLSSLAAVALVLLTPWMVRRTPEGVWPRFLMVAIPALALTGFLAVSATRATRSLKAVGELAKLCDANEMEASAQTRLLRLNEMNLYIEDLYQQRYDELQRIGEIE